MLNRNLILIALVVFCAGCGYQMRTYVMTKDRVGLDRGNGNGGCLEGTCPPPAPPKETTRKVYVLEVTKPVPESEVKKIEETAVNAIVTEPSSDDNAAPSAPAASSDNTQPAAPAAVQVPVVGELPGSVASDNSQATTTAPVTQGNGGNIQTTAGAGGTTYTVQKDDTLQKISKKVFGTYSKWYKIYQANKDKISNPNVLKPGTVLTIPDVK